MTIRLGIRGCCLKLHHIEVGEAFKVVSTTLMLLFWRALRHGHIWSSCDPVVSDTMTYINLLVGLSYRTIFSTRKFQIILWFKQGLHVSTEFFLLVALTITMHHLIFNTILRSNQCKYFIFSYIRKFNIH